MAVHRTDHLQRARTYVETMGENTGALRQNYHFMAPTGWMNDPNGLIQFKGDYHLFYQFNPYAPEWGMMHWGHAVSPDLVHWKHLPVALAPSAHYDDHPLGGVFSGSAVDDGGTLAVVYTGTTNYGAGFVQTQCLATSRDGVEFEKDPGNPVISDFPPADGSSMFRDPKLLKHHGFWYMVVGSSKDGQGRALLYRSADLRSWTYIGVVAESSGRLGSMWECPDLFPLGGRHVLMFSPMHLGNRKTVYLIGDMDFETGRLAWDIEGEVDWGTDYYAPQSFADDKGRRILIAWQNNWDWMPWFQGFGATQAEGWCGSLSIPRAVRLAEDGRLLMEPVEELARLRREHSAFAPFDIRGEWSLPIEDGVRFELIVGFDLLRTDASAFGLLLRRSEAHRTRIEIDPKERTLSFDRSHSDGYSKGIRSCGLEMKGDVLELHLFSDASSIEIFTDGGRTTMSCNVFPTQADSGLALYAHGGSAAICRLEAWRLDGRS